MSCFCRRNLRQNVQFSGFCLDTITFLDVLYKKADVHFFLYCTGCFMLLLLFMLSDIIVSLSSFLICNIYCYCILQCTPVNVFYFYFIFLYPIHVKRILITYMYDSVLLADMYLFISITTEM